MFIFIGIMIVGIVIGYIFRKKHIFQHINKGITVTIWSLLFLMGYSVGANEQLIRQLPVVGWQALLLALAGTLGSALAAKFIYIYFFKQKRQK